MTTKRVAVILIGIFCILGLSLEKTKAIEESSPTPTAKIDYSYYHVLYAQYEEAKTQEEKNAINVKIITGPVSDIEQDNELKYDALFRLMAGNPTKEQVQQVIAQFKKEKTWTTKKDLMDALSNSRYKDIIAEGYKKIAETDEDLFIRGFATQKLISTGHEDEGFEVMKKLINDMEVSGKTPRLFMPYKRFKIPEMEEKVKTYMCNLRDDASRSGFIRCYAVLTCHEVYKSKLEPYYQLIEKTVLDKNTKESEAGYLLGLMYYFGEKNNNKEAKNIVDKAGKSGNEIVKSMVQKLRKVKY